VSSATKFGTAGSSRIGFVVVGGTCNTVGPGVLVAEVASMVDGGGCVVEEGDVAVARPAKRPHATVPRHPTTRTKQTVATRSGMPDLVFDLERAACPSAIPSDSKVP
jgi:hypothetical protein